MKTFLLRNVLAFFGFMLGGFALSVAIAAELNRSYSYLATVTGDPASNAGAFRVAITDGGYTILTNLVLVGFLAAIVVGPHHLWRVAVAVVSGVIPALFGYSLPVQMDNMLVLTFWGAIGAIGLIEFAKWYNTHYTWFVPFRNRSDHKPAAKTLDQINAEHKAHLEARIADLRAAGENEQAAVVEAELATLNLW